MEALSLISIIGLGLFYILLFGVSIYLMVLYIKVVKLTIKTMPIAMKAMQVYIDKNS